MRCRRLVPLDSDIVFTILSALVPNLKFQVCRANGDLCFVMNVVIWLTIKLQFLAGALLHLELIKRDV